MIVILTFLALVLGLLCGLSGTESEIIRFISKNSDMILYILMFSVGISIGMHNGILKKIRQYHLKILIIPLGITAGSILGGLLCSLTPEASFKPGRCCCQRHGLVQSGRSYHQPPWRRRTRKYCFYE